MSDEHSTKTALVSGVAPNDGAAGPVAVVSRPAAPTRRGVVRAWRKWLLLAAVIMAGGAVFLVWQYLQPAKLPAGFASSNGRIEATEVDIATKLALRVKQELVDEGDYVTAGQVVAYMDTDTLQAQRREAVAKRDVALSAVDAAQASVKQREAEKAANEAVVAQRDAELDLAKREYDRVERLVAAGGSASREELDTRRSALNKARAAVSSAKANVSASESAIATARAAVIAAQAAVVETKATIDRVQTDIDDSALKAPRAGRIQYRVAQPGEMLQSGGKVLNMIDLSDVYMTFFLPTDWAGKVQMGAEVRLVLDAAPQFVIPAKVTFIADVAQFTPKTVETAVERQKLTFRIKAHIPPELLQKHVRNVKTGLPGVAYVQLDPQAKWPAHLEVNLPQ